MIPILGQKFKLKSYAIIITVECQQCETKQTCQLLHTGQVVQCPCGATYQLAAIEWYLHDPAKTRIGIADTPTLRNESEPKH